MAGSPTPTPSWARGCCRHPPGSASRTRSIFPSIESERLLLRPFRDEDLDAYQAMINHPDAMAAVADAEPLSRPRSWRGIAVYLGHWAMRGYGPFAVEERASGAFVGRVGPWRPEGWPGLELIWEVDRAYWGRGYATEAALAARDFTFETVGPDVELISLIEPSNQASRRVAEKLGAVRVREVEHDGMQFGVYQHRRPRM